MKVAVSLLVIGILLLAIGVAVWQLNAEHQVATGYWTNPYETIPANSTSQAIGLGLAVVGLGSTVVGLVLFTKKRE